jgi:hypothetical protein
MEIQQFFLKQIAGNRYFCTLAPYMKNKDSLSRHSDLSISRSFIINTEIITYTGLNITQGDIRLLYILYEATACIENINMGWSRYLRR